MPKKLKKLSTDHIVKESNELARARIMPPSTTIWDERVIAAFAARNTCDETVFKEHKLDLRELLDTKELSTRQYNEAKNAIKKMAHKTFEIPYGQRGIEIYPIFATLKLNDDGVITGEFNPKLAPDYLELRRQFAERFLPDFQKLRSIYAQKLYRLLNSWHRTNMEIAIELSELHSLLGTPESFRKEFRNFRVNVLDVAHKEINATAQESASDKPLEFDWEPVKKGLRKVVAVRFIFDIHARKVAAKAGEVLDALRNGKKTNATY